MVDVDGGETGGVLVAVAAGVLEDRGTANQGLYLAESFLDPAGTVTIRIQGGGERRIFRIETAPGEVDGQFLTNEDHVRLL